MESVIRVIDAINYRVGRTIMWLTVALAIVQFVVVILRYVFAIGFIPMQESIWYMNGILFMTGAGFTLLADGHVRVDVLYREISHRNRAWVDLIGTLVFLVPVCLATLYLSWSYVLNSWRVFEGSTETSGIQGIFLLKTFIWVFAFLVVIQGIANALRAVRYLRDGHGHYTPAGISGGATG
ncbi:MAG: TRAP transporter small permease subunit [Rhodobiaceae bacterium]|nr:TRAP transporter small permease subunit [Rhodobiaceae bacterium]